MACRSSIHGLSHQTKTASKIGIAINQDIQIGESTHHHDQVIYPTNLSVMKRMVRSPTNPTPLLEFELSMISPLFTCHSIYECGKQNNPEQKNTPDRKEDNPPTPFNYI